MTTQNAQSSPLRYHAFLSYSHQDNVARRSDDAPDTQRHIAWANWLHNELETYKVPKEFVGRPNRLGEAIPARLVPCFQDEKELPTEARLQNAIEEALRASRYLIVLCSPRSSRSFYVNAEVKYFKSLGRADRILPIIIAGEPNAARVGGKPGFADSEECFCPALKHAQRPDGTLDESTDEEPVCADARWGEPKREISADKQRMSRPALEYAKLKLIAGLLGIGFDDLVQRDKERQLAEQRLKARRLQKLVAGFAALACVASAFGLLAWKKSHEATAENHARLQLLQHAARSEHAVAENLFRQGNWEEAVNHLARSLNYDPNNRASAAHFWSAIVHDAAKMPARLLWHIDRRAGGVSGGSGTVFSQNIVGLEGERGVDYGGINALAGSADHSKIALCSFGRPAQVFDLSSGQPVSEEIACSELVTKVALSPSGETLALGDGTVWTKASGVVHLAFSANSSLTFSLDGRSLLACGSDGSVDLWDAKSGARTKSFSGHSNVVVGVFNPQGTLILTADLDGTLIARNTNGQGQPKVIKCEKGVVEIAYAPDGTHFVTRHIGGVVQVWTGMELQASGPPYAHPAEVFSVCFSPDGRLLATACDDGLVRIWAIGSGPRATRELDCGGQPVALAFNPNGTALAVACAGSASAETSRTKRSYVALWHVGNGTEKEPFSILYCDATRLVFSKTGEALGTAGPDGVFRLWDCAESLRGVQIVGRAAGDRKQFAVKGMADYTFFANVPGPNLPDHERWLPTIEQAWVVQRKLMSKGSSVFAFRGSRKGPIKDIWDSMLNLRCWDDESGFAHTEVLHHQIVLPDVVGPMTGAVASASQSIKWADDGSALLTEDEQHVVRSWRIFSPSEPAPPWITSLAEFVTGLRSDETNLTLSPMSDGERSDREKTLRSLITGTNEWNRLAAWALLSPSQRSVSPLDSTTPAQWADKAIEVNTENDIRAALAVSPSHPLVRVALSGFIDDTGQAVWMKARALKLLPADADVCLRAAEIFMVRKDWAGAKEAVDYALKAAPDHVKAKELRKLLDSPADKALDSAREGSN